MEQLSLALTEKGWMRELNNKEVKYALDRFEGQFAILQDDNKQNLVVQKALLPAMSEPGMVFVYNKILEKFEYDAIETQLRKDRILKLQDELFE